MTTNNESQKRIPVICVTPSSVRGAEVFDVNFWSGLSKGIVQSCWTEYSVLHHCVQQLSELCKNSEKFSADSFELLQKQWQASKFDLSKIICFSQQPEMHIRVEAFFSGVKTLLDLLVQLLSSENIVNAKVDGFHRDQNGYGGRVLNALRNNAVKNRKNVVEKIYALIVDHKKKWIDLLILGRDQLIHPEKGMQQLMFVLEIKEDNGVLVLTRARPPEIESKPMHEFAQHTLEHVKEFSVNFMALLREPASNT